MKDASIESVLNKIEEISEFYFLFNHKLIDVERKVDVSAEEEPIKDILSEIFSNDVSVIVSDRQIVLTPAQGSLALEKLVQQQVITGIITDNQTSNPMPGVNIQIKGTTIGTISDASGKYSISVTDRNATLVFSFVGYSIQELPLNGRVILDVTLTGELTGLDEVVVIGYGTQAKANLTGAVVDFRSNQIENKPVTKVSQLFAGQVTGLSSQQVSGEPGQDASEILIRGRGTFSSAGNSALVLVDGIPSSLDNLDPNTIESISVLKDAASAAIYGARAANGVILVTTKRGHSSKINVTYNGYVGWNKPSEFPDVVDSWQYAELYNEAAVNGGQQPFYSAEEIQKYKDGTDPDYANVKHVEDLFNSGSGFQTNHSLIFSGSVEKNKYFVSFSTLDQNGLIRENWLKRYNFTVNLDQEVLKNVVLSVNLLGYTGKSNEPVVAAGQNASTTNQADNVRMLYQMAYLTPPTFPDKYPDGSYYPNSRNYLAALDSDSFRSQNESSFMGSANIAWNILNSLKVSGKIGYVYNQNYYKNFNATFEYNQDYKTSPAWLREDISNNSNLILQSIIEFNKKFNDHSINSLAGYSREYYPTLTHGLVRNTFANNFLTVMNAGAQASWQNSGNLTEWGLQSFFGRLQYSFQDKYLFEANIRYDGSSRFPKSRRYALFPSFSGAWKISKEKFFNVDWINDLKLRASWGELGNQNIGNYSYQTLLSLSQNYPIGNIVQTGASITTLANKEITWETTRIIDYGLDVSSFKSKLILSVDYFNKKTTGVLFRVPSGSVIGFSSPLQNAATVSNVGWEFQLIYKNSFHDLTYNLSPNFSSVRTKLLELPNTDKIITLMSNDYYVVMMEGEPMNSFYGYKTEGLFVDQTDIDNYAIQPSTAHPGDIKYKDISGPDGVPDGVVDPTYDRTPLGSDYPNYYFGANIGASYKHFDVSLLLNGVGGIKGILRRWMSKPFDDGGTNVQRWQLDRWTTEDPNPNARLPRLLLGWNAVNNASSDFWIIDASYLKIKYLQFGYSFPESIVQKLRIDLLRIYFSATNLHSFDHYYKGYDPDMRVASDARLYPVTSTYTFGINITL
jgi:TonB-linked SusC/RagA family outer membrane protein